MMKMKLEKNKFGKAVNLRETLCIYQLLKSSTSLYKKTIKKTVDQDRLHDYNRTG